MTQVNTDYGTPASIAITTTSLATHSTLLNGRESAVVDNTTEKATTSILGGSVAIGSSPTAETYVEVWLFGSWNGTDFTAGAGNGNANLNMRTQGEKSLMYLAETVYNNDTTARTYEFGPINVAKVFGDIMPQKWGVFVVHNTGVNLGATVLEHTPVHYENV